MPTLRVEGYRSLMKALKELEPGLRKDTLREINRAAGAVVKTARGYVPPESPMSGWTPEKAKPGSRWAERSFIADEVRAKIRTTRGQSKPDRTGYRNDVGIVNGSAAGVIYELAGTKSRGMTPQGKKFVENIAATGLRTPLRRLVFRAVLEMQESTNKRVGDALKRAGIKFNTK